LRKTYAVAGALAASLIALAAISPLLSARITPTQIPFSLTFFGGTPSRISSVNYTAPDGSNVTVNMGTNPNVSVTGLIGTTPVSDSTVNTIITSSQDANECIASVTTQLASGTTMTLGPLVINSLTGFGTVNTCTTPNIITFLVTGSGILSINGKSTSVTLQAAGGWSSNPPLVIQGLITVG
jgi:hypothetical protein